MVELERVELQHRVEGSRGSVCGAIARDEDDLVLVRDLYSDVGMGT